MSAHLAQLVIGARLGFSRKGSKNYTALAGTVTATNGSTALVGAGTTFTGMSVGQTIKIKETSGAITLATITTITDDTNIVLSAAYGGDGGAGLTAYKEAGTLCSPTVKPVSAVPANWPAFGTVMEPDFDPGSEYDEVFTAEQGALELSNLLLKKTKSVWKLKLNEVSELTFEAALNAAEAMVDATPAVLQAGSGQLPGWWQFICKSGGTQALIIEQYGIGTVKGFKMPGGHVMPECEIHVLSNPLNTATLSLSSF